MCARQSEAYVLCYSSEHFGIFRQPYVIVSASDPPICVKSSQPVCQGERIFSTIKTQSVSLPCHDLGTVARAS
jgi:hypothetical protein